MRSLGERLHMLRKLINLRCGPGAAVIPQEVSRIHMDFATKINGGHMGARKFWREYLPRLKYHNPSIPMIVNRHDQTTTSPIMTIYLRNSGSAAEPYTQTPSSRTNLSKAQAPASDERTVQIDMKDKQSSQILEFFMAETRAVPLQPTPEEVAEIQELDKMRKQSNTDRERVGRVRAEKKREEEMLKRAKAAGGMGEEDQA